MSLLNQVLQDLDERAPQGARQPVRLASAPAAVDYADDFEQRLRPDWTRAVAWTLLSAAVVAGAWVYLALPGVPRVAPVQAVLPQAVVTTPTPAAARTAAEPVAADTASTPSQAATGPADIEPAAVRGGSGPTVDPAPRVQATAGADVSRRLSQTPAAEPGTRAAAPADVASPVPDYLPLRNVELPPAPRAARRATPATPPVVKTQIPPADRPLAEIRHAIESGEIAHAELLLQERLQAAPRDRDARELLLGLMLRGDRIDAALQQLEQGLQHHPGHAKFVVIKARLLAQRGDTASAVALLENLRGAGAEALQMLGALYQQQGEYARAAETYRALLAKTPAAGPAWVGLAVSLDGLGDAEAAGAYRRALELGGLPAAAEQYARQRVTELGRGDG